MPQTLVNQYARASKSISATPINSIEKPSLSGAAVSPNVVDSGLPHAGVGLGNAFRTKRYRKVRIDGLRGITKGDIRRLARRGGVKRIKLEIYEKTRDVLQKRVREIVKRAVAICTGARRKVVKTQDIVYALHTMGEELYGFGTHFVERPDKREKKKRTLDQGQIAQHTAEIVRLAEANRRGMELAGGSSQSSDTVPAVATPGDA